LLRIQNWLIAGTPRAVSHWTASMSSGTLEMTTRDNDSLKEADRIVAPSGRKSILTVPGKLKT
jgi:hypothetical protein